MASTMLVLPLPFGPMIAVIPGANSKWILCTKDLKPVIVSVFRTAFGAEAPPSMTFSSSLTA